MDGYYIGLMTGSSTDAIDAALVCFDQKQPVLINAISRPYPSSLRETVISAQHGDPLPVTELCRLDAQLGSLLADTAHELISDSDLSRQQIHAIGSHGQTVCHLPDESPAGTLQLGDPAQIAEKTQTTVVADFRSRDMAAGGQGAPFASALHAAYLRSTDENRCVLNLGGIANLTVLPSTPDAPVLGFDTGPANSLMDYWVEKLTGKRFDMNGDIAASGSVDPPLLQRWLSDPYFSAAPPKSTGRDYFSDKWLLASLATELPLEDMVATLAELTAVSIADAVRNYGLDTQTMLVCGGGANNHHLMSRLSTILGDVDVRSTATEGIDPQWTEAILVAWLAARTINGLPGNLPSVTGALGERICGAIYPA